MALRAAFSRSIVPRTAPFGSRWASSWWGHVDPTPKYPIHDIAKAFLPDPSPEKVNIGVSAYRGDNKKTVVLDCIRAAEVRMRIAGNLNIMIVGILGLGKDDGHENDEDNDDDITNHNHNFDSNNQVFVDPIPGPRKGFSAPVQVVVDRPITWPLLVSSNGDGGVQ